MLSERLQELVYAEALTKSDGEHGPEYQLTKAGMELATVVGALAMWGQRWLPRIAHDEDNDLQPLLVDMQRRVRFDALPKDPIVVRFEIDQHLRRFMLLKPTEASICVTNPGFPELTVRSPLFALVAWWRGDCSFFETRRMGLRITGKPDLVRSFADWFERYQFASIPPETDAVRREVLPA